MTPDQLRKLAEKKRKEGAAQAPSSSKNSLADTLRAKAEAKRKATAAPAPVETFKQPAPTQEMRAYTGDPDKPLPRINMEREVGLGATIGAGIKQTNEGRASYLESTDIFGGGYGEGNVATDANGEMFVFDKEANEYFPVNKDGFTVNDIAQHSGTIMEVAPALAAAPTMIGAAAGSAAGNIGRQAMSMALPGDDQMSLQDRAMDLGINTAVGAAGQGLLNFGVNAIRGPKNFVAGRVQKAMQSPYAQESQQLADAMGLDLPYGSATGNPTLKWAEKTMRQHPFAADIAEATDNKNLNSAVTYLNSVMDKTFGHAVGDEKAGKQITKAFDDATKAVIKKRHADGVRDFAAIEMSLPPGTPVFSTNSFGAAVDEEISTLKSLGAIAGDEAKSTMKALTKIRDAVTAQDGSRDYVLTAAQMQNLLQRYGEMSKGTGLMWNDISEASQKRIAKKLFGALQDDLDATANAPFAAEASVGQLLKTARDNYRMNSDKLREIEESTLGRIFAQKFDPAPEQLADRFARMKPTQVQTAFEILEKSDPNITQQLKRYLLENVMDKAGIATEKNAMVKAGVHDAGDPLVGQAGGRFNPEKFLTEVRNSPYWTVAKPQERTELLLATKGIERLADKQLWSGSQTTFAGVVNDVVGAMMNPVGAVGALATKVVAPRKMAELLFTEQGRRSLITVTTSPKPTTKAINALNHILVSMGQEPLPENIRPSEDFDAAIEAQMNAIQKR